VILDASATAGHAAPTAEVYFGPLAWPADGGEPGACELFALGEKWACFDDREELPMSET
jgi:hypothetical protein